MDNNNSEQFQANFLKCQQLQKKLKDQYLLLMTQQDQKANFQKKLNNSLNNFYRNFVHLDLTYRGSNHNQKQQIQNQKRLFEDEGFGNCYIFIKDIMLILSKTPQLCLKLIEKHNNWENINVFDGIIKVLTNSMFENIVDEDLSHKDIIYFMNGILDLVINSKKKPQQISFYSKSLVFQILRQFMRKPQYLQYSDKVVKGTLLEIAKMDHLIDFTSEGQQDVRSLTTKKQHLTKKSSQSPLKKKPTSFKNVHAIQKATSKVEIYCQALKKKDSKIRTKAMIRTKNRNCASNDLLRFLGIIDNINFPTFSCVSSEAELKQEERISQQWTMVLNKKQSNLQNYSPDIGHLKNLVFIIFGDIFKMLYSMPMMIRILCRMMYQKLMQKTHDRKNCLIIIGNFVIGYWICQSLKFDDLLYQSGKISEYTHQNSLIVSKAVIAVIRGDYQLVDRAFHNQFNLIISNLRLSVFNYLSQLINIQLPKFDKSHQVHQIKNHTVCLSIADISLFLKMISNVPEDTINQINDKLLKKIKKVKQISQGTQIFGNRFDKALNKEYKDYQSYVLFSEVVFPKDLSYDYMKYYNDAFKKQKLKNTLRQILLNISDMNQYYQFPNDCRSLYEFFEHILKSRQQRLNLNAIDRAPVELKIKYLLSLCKYKPMQEFISSMHQQVDERMKIFKQVWDRSKQYYLKAISSVIQQNQKISKNQITLQQQMKKQRLNQFMAKFKINICLTSPKTRQKQIVLKTTVMGDIHQQQKNKIWLQNQLKCMHTALNLDFIKSLTGEAQKPKVKYQSHFSYANKFADIFCSLPQVKQNGMSGQDKIGIKQILDQFISFCIDTLKTDEKYNILSKDTSWLESNLQQKITKKIYDKLYPKYPTFQDLAFFFRLKTLDWVSYQHLKIEPAMRVSGMWDIAAKILKQVQKMKTASEKLDKILQCSRIIQKSYKLVGNPNKAITLDDIYPIVIYILIKAAPRRIISNINFIEMYANKNKLISRDGYFLTQLKSAIMYCQNMSHQELGMGMVEFNKKIYQKQVQYGIYFMIPRRRNSPRTTLRKIQYLKKHYFGEGYNSIIGQKQQKKQTHNTKNKHRKNSQGKICVSLPEEQ